MRLFEGTDRKEISASEYKDAWDFFLAAEKRYKGSAITVEHNAPNALVIMGDNWMFTIIFKDGKYHVEARLKDVYTSTFMDKPVIYISRETVKIHEEGKYLEDTIYVQANR